MTGVLPMFGGSSHTTPHFRWDWMSRVSNKLVSCIIKLLPGLTTGPSSRFVGKATYLLSSMDIPGILIEKM